MRRFRGRWWWPGHRNDHSGPSWDCKAVIETAKHEHHCVGHANSRPEHMHRCECGFRWTA